MGIDVEKDCVVRPDGTHVCFDQEKEVFYQFKKLPMSEVNEKDIAAIMRKQCNVKKG